MSLSFYPHEQEGTAVIDWKPVGEIPQSAGVGGPVTGVHNDVLVVAGGANYPYTMPWLGGKKKYYREGYVFRKIADSLEYFSSFDLPFPLAYPANCSTPEGIVIAGGENSSGASSKSFMLRWDNARNEILIKKLPDLPFGVSNASLTYNDNKVYLAGGEMGNTVSAGFLMLDLNDTAKGWQQLPHLLQPVSHAVMITQSSDNDNCIYIIGGRRKNNNGISDIYASTSRFSLGKSQWEQKKPLPYALSAGTGIATEKKEIILFGGDKGEIFHKTEKILAAIFKENDVLKKAELNREKIKLQSSHPGFSRKTLLYNTEEDSWKIIDTMPFAAPVTTSAMQWDDSIYIPCGEIKAGVRTPQIISAKIK